MRHRWEDHKFGHRESGWTALNEVPLQALVMKLVLWRQWFLWWVSLKYVKQTLYRISIWISSHRWSLILFVSAPFFVDCISEQDLDEMNIEIIRNTLYKAYLEAFFNFCKELGGTTADVMCEILAVSNEWKDYLRLGGKECWDGCS